MTTINQKEYLKKYLAIGKTPGEKKKKKKREKAVGNRLTIIDDDVDVLISKEIENDIATANEDAPQIVAVIDERPHHMQVDEKTNSCLWKPLGEPLNSEIVDQNLKLNSFKLGKQQDNLKYSSQNRNNLERTKVKQEDNYSRKSDSSHSKKDVSPPRRKNNEDSSPPRRKIKEEDISPPRRINVDDNSPLRKRNKEDSSPPRRRNNEDSSPPRRRKIDNLAERRTEKGDFSQERRKLKDDKKGRKRESSPSSTHKRTEGSKKTRWGRAESSEASSSGKMTRTLDGKQAGLQNAKDLSEETKGLRQKEDELFNNMSAEVSGRNAATVIRGNKVKDPEEEAAKARKEQEMREKYDRWGKGLKQVEDQSKVIEEQLHEMSKPLARYADDEDLERFLKEQERDGDPMLNYIRKKKRKEKVAAGIPEKPTYMGEFMPNRFGIRPGYRWDGVDRSNGYEKKWFQVQNAKKADREEAFKWSTEDM